MSVTLEQHEKSLDNPAVCEQLPVRDYLDNVMVRTNGALVAGYALKGMTSYFASDDDRNRGKAMLGALLKSIPEQSMRVQVRFEVVEDIGNLLESYRSEDRGDNDTVRVLDQARLEAWGAKADSGFYLRPLLHVYFIWDTEIHHRIAGKGKRKIGWTLSADTAIERTRREHEGLVAEFESLLVGVEATMQAAELGARRLTDHELFLEAKRVLDPLNADRVLRSLQVRSLEHIETVETLEKVVRALEAE